MKLALLLFIIIIANGNSIVYKDCGSNIGKLISVKVPGCTSSTNRCRIKRGKAINIKIKFLSEKSSENVDTFVQAIVYGMPIPLDVLNGDACTDSSLSCPIVAGKNYTYRKEGDIPNIIPKMDIDVQWELTNGSDKYVCIIIPSTIF